MRPGNVKAKAEKPKPKPPAKKKDERAFYERLIESCLERKFIPIGLALVALYGATSLVPAIGSQFFPAGVRDQIFVHVDLPADDVCSIGEVAMLADPHPVGGLVTHLFG